MSDDPKAELEKSRSELLAVLDEKLKNMPEWRAFRAINRAYVALISANGPKVPERRNGASESFGTTYADLGLRLMTELGRPVPTLEAIQYLRAHRGLPADEERAKNIISSAFSHDERIESVPWHGGRAWWFANREVPANV